MVKLNVDAIDDYESDLIYFKDYIPLRLYPYVNLVKRNNYLKRKGLKSKIDKIVYKKKLEMRNANNPFEYAHNDFVKWVKSNPEFKELLI